MALFLTLILGLPLLLVTALNSAPVIFYPTDTFAELEIKLEPRFFSGRQLCMQYRWPAIDAQHYSHCRYSGRVVSAVLETYWARGSNPKEGLTSQQPYRHKCAGKMCRRVGAGGQTGTEAWRRQRQTLNNQA
jgi:hypothetical protein